MIPRQRRRVTRCPQSRVDLAGHRRIDARIDATKPSKANAGRTMAPPGQRCLGVFVARQESPIASFRPKQSPLVRQELGSGITERIAARGTVESQESQGDPGGTVR